MLMVSPEGRESN